MKSKKRFSLTERDFKILRFLWKWKIISSYAIANKFYPEAKAFTAYRRLVKLNEDGYITSIPVEGRFNEAWSLTEKGFKIILPKLGELSSQSYKSENPYHDFLASSFHLGEWLTRQPDNTQTYSERQLRCFHNDIWPSWIPRSKLHRPDGFSVYQNQNGRVIIAFETELSVKAQDRYASVVTYYDSEPSIKFVFWLVDSRTTLNALKKSFHKHQIRDYSKHNFILLSDYRQKGWMAQIIEGKFINKRLSDFLQHNGYSIPTQSLHSCDTLALLDSRKRPIIPNTKKLSKPT